MFMSKSKKMELERIRKEEEALAEQRALEEKEEKQYELKMNVKRTLKDMKNQSLKLETLRDKYIEEARRAMNDKDKNKYNMYRRCLKFCIGRKKVIDIMIANFESMTQCNDMKQLFDMYSESSMLLCDNANQNVSDIDMAKAKKAFEGFMNSNEKQYESINSFMDSVTESIDSFDGVGSDISDREVDMLISSKGINDEESMMNDEIDDKISSIRVKIK